ncbi:flagellar assembly protein FliW [Shouchella sp. 1P09AA]|uniref:flagellar assembly protein FliW n=1 Tax=unclassified Shouchella TaxID=2893065 RepID=UPI0039A1EF44
MQVETNYLGTLEIEQADVLHFPNGLPGFPLENEFVLIPFPQSDFYLLQSTKGKHVAFVCLNPFSIWKDYRIELDQKTIDQLNIETETDVAVFVLVTVKEPFSTSTANLNAPLVVNTVSHLGKQLIYEAQLYSSKALLAGKGGE